MTKTQIKINYEVTNKKEYDIFSKELFLEKPEGFSFCLNNTQKNFQMDIENFKKFHLILIENIVENLERYGKLEIKDIYFKIESLGDVEYDQKDVTFEGTNELKISGTCKNLINVALLTMQVEKMAVTII